MNKTLPWFAFFVVLFVAGCALPKPARLSGDDRFAIAGSALFSSANRSRVALDLISTLRQVDGYAPEDGTLDISRLQGPFGDSLKRVLAAKGYRSSGLADSGDTLLQFQLRRAKNSNQSTVILIAGPVRIKRDYQLVKGHIQPASYLYILGAPADNIEPDDSIFVTSATSWQLPPASDRRTG